MREAARAEALVLGPALAWPPGALVALGQPSPGTGKVVFSTQLLLCGATCTHYTITHTNKDNMPKSPSLTLTWVSADQRSRVHTLTHTHMYIYTYTHQNTSCAPTGDSPTTAVCLPRRDLGWMVNVHNCTGPSVSLSAPLPLSPARGRGRGSWQRGHLPSRYPEPCSSSPRLRRGQPFPCRLPEVASLGLQVEIEALTGAGAAARRA